MNWLIILTVSHDKVKNFEEWRYNEQASPEMTQAPIFFSVVELHLSISIPYSGCKNFVIMIGTDISNVQHALWGSLQNVAMYNVYDIHASNVGT